MEEESGLEGCENTPLSSQDFQAMSTVHIFKTINKDGQKLNVVRIEINKCTYLSIDSITT